MSEVMNYYSIADFNQFFKNKIFTPLEQATEDILSYLEKNIIIPTGDAEAVPKKPERYSENRHRRGNGKRGGDMHRSGSNRDISSADIQEEWNKMRAFKTTKIEVKEGADKSFTEIRALMNKLSAKNYDATKDAILTILEELDQEDETIRYRIVSSILDVVCGNAFYSSIYADLYKELVSKYELFEESLPEIISRYVTSLQTIYFVDPNTDYDGFCNYTKQNDLRKASASFILHLMKKEVLSKDSILSILTAILDLLKGYIDEENRTNEFDELTENLFLCMKQCKGFLESEPIYISAILPTIQYFSKQSTKEHKSLSSRAVFKYMDMI
jgi:hypothetical protein